MPDNSNVHKGRGAGSNPKCRFQPLSIALDIGTEETRSEYREVDARSIISSNRSPDVPFEQSVNPYQGCEHGCIYCYARPTHAYLDLSPGLDFETKIECKRNAAALLQKRLAQPSYRCSPITIGANTDPYQPAEAQLGITRSCLEVLESCNHPVSLITKSSLVSRDIDIIAAMAARQLASVAISVTTLDRVLKRTLEPRAASGRARLQTISSLSAAGIPVTVLFAPVIPAINDSEMEAILEAASQAGATAAGYILLRMPMEVEGLFTEWLEAHHPMRAKHVMSLLRQSRNGRVNDPRFGHRMRGSGPFAELLRQRFRLSCKRYALNMGESPSLRTDLFRPPAEARQQMGLF